MRPALLTAAAVVLTFTPGCGGTTLGSLCQRSAQVQCQKLFECSPSTATQQGFTSQSDCVTKTTAKIDCASFDTITCTGIDYGPYNRCLDDMSKLACTAQSQPDSCKGLSDPGSSGKCTSSDGRIVCQSASATAGSSGCSETRTGCGDGKTYAVTCAGTACTCTVDGATT
jgi:hypothetical protein